MTQQLQPPRDPPRAGPTLVLADRYRVFDVLGRGGMAAVHRGHDLRLDRPVAVKLLHPHLAHDERVRTRFRQEAHAVARLNHRGVVAVYDHWDGDDDAPPYLVMELVDGGSVRDVLDVRGSLSPGQTLALLRPAMMGLADAHARGLVHRDVTPANVLVTAEGASKLGDFGLARAAALSAATFPDGVVGSPHYMSPEAVSGRLLDARADVYSLGCMLFECLTGAPPFDGDSPQAIAVQHGIEPVPAPSRVVPGIPRTLDELIATATSAEPDDRYADAAALVVALDRAVPDGPEPIDLRTATRSLRIDPAHATTTLDDDPVTVLVGAEQRAARRRWLQRTLAGAAAAAVVAAGGYAAWDQAIAPVTEIRDVRGLDLDLAREALTADGFEVVVADEPRHDLRRPEGAVLTQAPMGDARRGATIRLVESAGPRTAALPVLVGHDIEVARTAVDELGIDLQLDVSDGYDDDAPQGTVLSSTPEAGVEVQEASVVSIVVSVGPAPVELPAVAGDGQARATATLRDLGLQVAVVEQRHHDSVPQGSVIATRPKAGTELRRGDEVGLVISRGPSPVEIPDVTGLAEEDAIAELEALGLEVEVREISRLLPLGLGTVDSQAPSAGQVRPTGSTVRIFVWRLG